MKHLTETLVPLFLYFPLPFLLFLSLPLLSPTPIPFVFPSSGRFPNQSQREMKYRIPDAEIWWDPDCSQGLHFHTHAALGLWTHRQPIRTGRFPLNTFVIVEGQSKCLDLGLRMIRMFPSHHLQHNLSLPIQPM